MRTYWAITAILPIIFNSSCLESGRGTSRCKTDLNYVTNRFTAGEEAIRNASVYVANITVGSDDRTIPTIVDTGSASLTINSKSFSNGEDTSLGNKSFQFDNGIEKGPSIAAKDSIDV